MAAFAKGEKMKNHYLIFSILLTASNLLISCAGKDSFHVPIEGCMDPVSLNFNPLAEMDDSSCSYSSESVSGSYLASMEWDQSEYITDSIWTYLGIVHHTAQDTIIVSGFRDSIFMVAPKIFSVPLQGKITNQFLFNCETSVGYPPVYTECITDGSFKGDSLLMNWAWYQHNWQPAPDLGAYGTASGIRIQ